MVFVRGRIVDVDLGDVDQWCRESVVSEMLGADAKMVTARESCCAATGTLWTSALAVTAVDCGGGRSQNAVFFGATTRDRDVRVRRIPVVWLCGPPGVGKTAVAWE